MLLTLGSHVGSQEVSTRSHARRHVFSDLFNASLFDRYGQYSVRLSNVIDITENFYKLL